LDEADIAGFGSRLTCTKKIKREREREGEREFLSSSFSLCLNPEADAVK
jgi:hypothetical protein